MSKRFLVTGGTGFLGSAVVHRLAAGGHSVCVLDNNFRGKAHRLADLKGSIEMLEGDIRDADQVRQAARNCDTVLHLAYINGTEFFYSQPELVLEVAVKGIINVLDACRDNAVRDLVLASSSEVYQKPPQIPTGENVPLVVPDIHNPRFSYGGGKIISELLALNYGRKFFKRVTVFRPHNVFGPDMGWEHVIPQLILKAKKQNEEHPEGPLPFPIQGQGTETRAFVYIDDFTDGLMKVIEQGEHQEIYNIGTEEEISINDVVHEIASLLGRKAQIQPGPLQEGSVLRRCPDIQKLKSLGYKPKFTFRQALPTVMDWYLEHAAERTSS